MNNNLFPELLPYSLMYSRMTIGALFLISVYGKLRNYANFLDTVVRFEILPQSITSLATVAIIGGELLVFGIMLLFGQYLLIGFGLTIVILMLFTATLASLLLRNIQTSCNCFGKNQTPVSGFDIARNIIIIGIASLGFISASAFNVGVVAGLLELGLLSLMTAGSVALLIHAKELSDVFFDR